MFCTQCGSQLPDGAKFCSNCGSAITPSILETPPAPQPAQSWQSPVADQPQAPEATQYSPAGPQEFLQFSAPEQQSPFPAQEQPVPEQPVYPSPDQPYAQPYYNPAPEQPEQRPYETYAAQNTPYVYQPQAPYTQPVQENPYPMKWFKFTIYFQLFANAVLNVVNAIVSFAGLSYGEDAATVYRIYPGIRGLDIFMGVLYLALAAFAIIARFHLAKFKKTGPTMLYIFLGANLAVLVFYAVAASVITHLSLVDSSMVSNAVTLVVLLVLDVIYFNKRKDLFVN